MGPKGWWFGPTQGRHRTRSGAARLRQGRQGFVRGVIGQSGAPQFSIRGGKASSGAARLRQGRDRTIRGATILDQGRQGFVRGVIGQSGAPRFSVRGGKASSGAARLAAPDRELWRP